MRLYLKHLAVLALLALTACATPPEQTTGPNRVEVLRKEILALGPGIDPAEAARAAELAYAYTAQLAEEYQITDPPLIHNTKVNMGIKPRGLCWHWAEDMETRLKAENFDTLTMHRAIANADNPFLIDHSTAIIARAGDDWDDGIVLDPWRFGGRLFWDEVEDDTRYKWVARDVVFEQKRARALGI